MNCRESPKRKCSCYYKRQQEVSNSSKNHSSQKHRASNNGNGYCESYAVPDEYFEKENECHFRKNGSRDEKQNVQLDESKLITLDKLRRRACRAIRTSDTTGLSDNGEDILRGSCCKDLSAGCSPKRKPPTLDYIPQSNFLRRMKQRDDFYDSLNNSPSPCNECDCSQCIADANRNRSLGVCCKCCPKEQYRQRFGSESPRRHSGPCSDVSSLHDPCSCFRVWRPKPCEGESVNENCTCFKVWRPKPCEGDYSMLSPAVDTQDGMDEICREFMSGALNGESKQRKNGNGTRGRKGKSAHISRSDKRKNRNDGRRKKKCPRRSPECESPEDDFEASLKRPHPDSCERCWRYASPSRSPVNKPNQRFDPNYRRSHSQVNIELDGRYASSNASHEFNPETKVHELMYSPARSLTRRRSTESIQETKMRHCIAKPLNGRPSRVNGEGLMGREESVRSPGRRVSSSYSGSPKNCVNFKERIALDNQVQDPMQCSPSMFDKSGRKSRSIKKSTSPPSSPESPSSKEKRQRPLSACEGRIKTTTDRSPRRRSRALSNEMNEYLNHTKQSDNAQPIQNKSCCCNKNRPGSQMTPRTPQNRSELFNQAFLEDNSMGRRCLSAKNSSRRNSNGNKSQDFDREQQYCSCCSCCLADSSLSRSRGEGVRGGCNKNMPLTLWDKESSVCESNDRGRTKHKNGESFLQNNPRKYCVFYMNKSKENEDDDIEVLIEELTEGKCLKDGKSKQLRRKMKRMNEPRGESMALRFQKGIIEKGRRPENNRILYF